jgi:glycosyltransferase involved in cell wall biosynthesis
MPGPLAVTHAVLSLDCGGLERVVIDLIREGRRRHQRVDVVCVERPGALAPEAERSGARVLCLNKAPGLSRQAAAAAVAALRQLRPDVLHTHQVGALLYAGRAARRAGVPVVVHTEHGNHVKAKSWSRRVRQRALWAVAARRARKFFCVSAEIGREVTRYGAVARRKVQVVANGINLDALSDGSRNGGVRARLGIPANAPVVGTVGRLTEVKRQDLLVRAFADLRVRLTESRLLLVGDGPARGELEVLVASLGLAGVVHFAGYQARPEEFLGAMDVFALTSRSEGMPLSVLEAWAAGRPVVTSAVGGLPTLIDDGRTGLLVSFGEERALVGALERVLTDRGYGAELGRAGRERVRVEFSLERMAADYEGQYRRLLDHCPTRAAA